MENVLTSFFVLLLLLYGTLTLGNATLTNQRDLQTVSEQVEVNQASQAHTKLESVGAQVTDNGANLLLTVRNSGSVKMTDFDRWDAIVEYYDENSDYLVSWVPYTAGVPLSGEWSVEGIYLSTDQDLPEAFGPGIFDPGEEMTIMLRLSPSLGVGQPLRLVLGGTSGVGVTVMARRNVPPTLTVNAVLEVNRGEAADITSAHLTSTDPDHDNDDLVYTITTPPAFGILEPDDSFTQSQIDSGQVRYLSNLAGEDDSFMFTVSDGVDTVGPYEFVIDVNKPPTLAQNTGATVMTGGTIMIGNMQLQVTDEDNTPDELTYTVSSPPLQGNFNLTTFTQEDIDNGLLSYTHTGIGSDTLQLTVSDGKSTLGPFIFVINVQ